MNRNLVIANLNEMSREELNATAKRIGCKIGKSKNNTVSNVADALCGVKGARCTVEFTIRKGESSAVNSEVIFASKFRTARAATPIVSAIVA